MIGATLESWHSRAMRVVVEGEGGLCIPVCVLILTGASGVVHVTFRV